MFGYYGKPPTDHENKDETPKVYMTLYFCDGNGCGCHLTEVCGQHGEEHCKPVKLLNNK
jgi:hypothetical protein